MGNISMADVFTVLPFENTVDVISMRGKDLKELFEQVAGGIKPDGSGLTTGAKFLQVSGMMEQILGQNYLLFDNWELSCFEHVVFFYCIKYLL